MMDDRLDWLFTTVVYACLFIIFVEIGYAIGISQCW